MENKRLPSRDQSTKGFRSTNLKTLEIPWNTKSRSNLFRGERFGESVLVCFVLDIINDRRLFCALSTRSCDYRTRLAISFRRCNFCHGRHRWKSQRERSSPGDAFIVENDGRRGRVRKLFFVRGIVDTVPYIKRRRSGRVRWKIPEWPHKFNESAAVARFFLNGNHPGSWHAEQ